MQVHVIAVLMDKIFDNSRNKTDECVSKAFI